MTLARTFRSALAASLAVCASLFFVWSWRWPLVGDASLIHYIAFLIQRGWRPYAQLGDMNMPGSYLIELGAMQVFGMGDLAWRIFDFSLMLGASVSFFVIARRKNWLAALFASSLFLLVHGRDGLTQAGQRDLTMAVCLLAATASLFLAVRRNATWPAVLFGLFSGIAITIKPTSFPLTLLQLALAVHAIRTASSSTSERSTTARTLTYVGLAYLVAPAIAVAFLVREDAIAAFLAGFHGIVPYYASLGHKPISFVALHSISPLLPLVIVWLILLALRPAAIASTQNWERNALLAGVLFGLINCIVQQRALPYYRYPLLAFLLPLMALDFYHAADLTPVVTHPPALTLRSWCNKTARIAAILGLGFGSFFLAPQSAVLIHRYRWWQNDLISSLDQNLNALGGSALSGHIQCIDSISGCGNALYRLRLEPATGVLSDFLLFGAISDQQPSESIPILRETRAQFSAAILAQPPQVIVVTSHLHIDGPDDFQKLARWPMFAEFLASRYTLRTQWAPTRTARWWSREETPASYRIYVLRGSTQ